MQRGSGDETSLKNDKKGKCVPNCSSSSDQACRVLCDGLGATFGPGLVIFMDDGAGDDSSRILHTNSPSCYVLTVTAMHQLSP